MELVLKTCVIVGAASAVTVSVAEAGAAPAVVVWVVVTPDAVLTCGPVVLLVTFTIMVQPVVGILIPEKLRLLVAVAMVLGVVPLQVPPIVPTVAMMLPSASVKAPPDMAEALLLVNEKVRVVVPPAGIDPPKASEIPGGAHTVRVAGVVGADPVPRPLVMPEEVSL
jgi:hypothetical protein